MQCRSPQPAKSFLALMVGEQVSQTVEHLRIRINAYLSSVLLKKLKMPGSCLSFSSRKQPNAGSSVLVALKRLLGKCSDRTCGCGPLESFLLAWGQTREEAKHK